MSWKPEVQTDSSGKWYQNGLAFETREEAEASVHDLAMRWLAVREWRAAESDEPVNYRWDKGLIPIDASENYLDRSKGADRIDGYDRDDIGESPDY